MKFINKFSKSFVALALVCSASSCSMFDLDVNTDPNNPTTAAPNLVLTRVQTDLADNFANHETTLGIFMGLQGTQGTSRFEVSNNSFNSLWSNMYVGALKEVDGLVSQSNPHYAGIGQLLKAYMYSTMVDQFGDVPFSQAGKADAATPNKTPSFDKDAAIYDACFKLIDDGIANLKKAAPAAVQGDVIYGGVASKWIKMGLSLKLKMLITGRLAITDAEKKIKDAITAGGFITTTADDFQFQFSKSTISIRHPYYTGAYTGGEFDATYVTHQLMGDMFCEEDPRWPFYFRRQNEKVVLNPAIPSERNEIPIDYLISNAAFFKKCFTDKGRVPNKRDTQLIIGMFGRTRGDMQGIPADGTKRLLPGVYPCGGFFDAGAAAIPAANAAPGGGIFPMITSINTTYYQIEAVLALGAAGDAKKLFEAAIRDHIAKVVNFGVATDPASVRPASTATDKYVALWLAKFDAAPDNNAKLDVCMKQLWYSSFGSSFESYNAFRRLGMPTTLDEHVVKPSRGFPLRMPYSQTELSLNANAPQGVIYDKNPIFWDK
jgi:Starch-binding associating with outer membrane